MTEDDARELVRRVLRQVAPEADLDTVSADETLQEALDLDSLDFLNFVVGLHQASGIEIPERDYPRLATLEGCVAYLALPRPAAGRVAEPAPRTPTGRSGSRGRRGGMTWTSN